MFFGFKREESILDEASIVWMIDVYQWILRNFDSRAFPVARTLIYPTNDYFPGQESTAEGMAILIFEQVKNYIGVSRLPCQLQNELGSVIQVSHGDNTSTQLPVSNQAIVTFGYNTIMLNAPEVLIASYAQQICHYLVTLVEESAPGGSENLPHAAEILATYLGFGVLMANTANTQKIRSCGSCSGPAIERASFLSQYDMTYALALFCSLKNIPTKEVLKHLKKTLHSYFKNSIKSVVKNDGRLNALKQAPSAIIQPVIEENITK